MSIEKNVYSALFKQDVKLSSEIVELANVSDIKKSVSAANKELGNVNGLTAKASAALDELFTSWRQVAVLSNSIISDVDGLKTKAKELELDLPADVLSMQDTWKEYSTKAQAQMKSLQTMRGNLK